MNSHLPCPTCGRPVPPESPAALCPACLMAGAMQPTGGAAPAPPSLDAVAHAFPQLEIISLLGAGGMGAVYKARQPGLDRLVALKILPESLAADPAFAQRFEREGRLLARLHHPNIVTVYDSGRAGPFFYLLMEYVEGVNLRQAMQAAPFEPAQALALVPRICEALQYAHDEGVLHRDIKPENILLDAKGRVKLADFGIAKLMGDPAADLTDAARGTGHTAEPTLALGTPRYMAPEQRVTPSAVDHRADIYSLGVVFYELLTGRTPEANFLPPSTVARIDARVDSIVKQALEVERERRQKTAAELKTQVEDVSTRTATRQEIRTAVQHLQAWEYKTEATIGGLPWVHVIGASPAPRTARGVFAFGPRAEGVFAFGGRARGLFACGGVATGVVAIGGVSLGFFSFGGVAAGLIFGLGGVAAGLVATGGLAFGALASGGLAVGWHAYGGLAIGQTAVGGRTEAVHRMADIDAWAPQLRTFVRWLAHLTPLTSLILLPPLLLGMLVPACFRRKGRPLAPEPELPPAAPLGVLNVAGWLTTALSWLALAGSVAWVTMLLGEKGGWHPHAAEALTVCGTWAVAALLVFGGATLRRAARATPLPGARRPWSVAVARGVFAVVLALTFVGACSWLVHAMERTDALRQAQDVARSEAEGRELELATQLFKNVEARHAAGVATALELAEARGRLDLARTARDPLKHAEARLTLAKARHAILEAQAEAGQRPLFDALEAELEVDRAQAAWNELHQQSLR